MVATSRSRFTSAAAVSRRSASCQKLLDQRRRLRLGERRVLGVHQLDHRGAERRREHRDLARLHAREPRQERQRQLLGRLLHRVDAVFRVARAQPGGRARPGRAPWRLPRAAHRSSRPAPTPSARAGGRCAARRTAPGSRRRRRALRRACCRRPPERGRCSRGRPAPAAGGARSRSTAPPAGRGRAWRRAPSAPAARGRSPSPAPAPRNRRCPRRRPRAAGAPRSRCRSPWRRAARAGRSAAARSHPAGTSSSEQEQERVSSKRMHQAPVRDPAGEREAGEQQQPLVGLAHRGEPRSAARRRLRLRRGDADRRLGRAARRWPGRPSGRSP